MFSIYLIKIKLKIRSIKNETSSRLSIVSEKIVKKTSLIYFTLVNIQIHKHNYILILIFSKIRVFAQLAQAKCQMIVHKNQAILAL